jgi:HD-like signal output (HDOD) protein
VKRLLIVDDDPDELARICDDLQRAEPEWQIDHAESGRQALQMMFRTSYDVIVSDFLMPKMEGAQLLKTVMKQSPQTIRILLSGSFDWHTTLRLLNIAHQYLSKPCDPIALREVIGRALFLRDLLANRHLQTVVAKMQSLPSIPGLYAELMKELQKDHAAAHQLGKIISQDPGMCTKMLQLVNSACFGLSQNISNPEEAVLYLGVETIKALVLSLQIFSLLDPTKTDHYYLQRLWQHCWGTANLAKRIGQAENLSAPETDHAFVAGLLHDVGKLVIVTGVPQSAREILQLHQHYQLAIREAEQTVLGCTHAEVGAYLLGLWGIPSPIVEAVALHHRPASCATRNFSAVSAVHVANALEHELMAAPEISKESEIDVAYLAGLNLTGRLPFWRQESTNLVRP